MKENRVGNGAQVGENPRKDSLLKRLLVFTESKVTQSNFPLSPGVTFQYQFWLDRYSKAQIS